MVAATRRRYDRHGTRPGEDPMMIDGYRSVNREYWDREVALNLETWDIDGFLRDPARLTMMVTADRPALGEVKGKRLIHLQCHFGLDTLAWARLGAVVTGVDLAPRAIATARDLARRGGLPARFVEAELYAVPEAIAERFEFVYTGGGALCWLPDIRGWAAVVGRLLEPGGVFYIREAHPVLWSLEDERSDPELVIGLPYFETASPKRWEGAPAWDQTRNAGGRPHYVWQRGLGEVVTALIEAGLTIQYLREHRTCLWQALPFMVQDEAGWWRLPERAERLPLMYSIRAVKA
jgi:SAM-dependent methyltransferase